MKAETLADELEALIETIGGAGGLLVKNKAMIELAKSAPDLLSALRRVEMLEAALQMIIDTRPDDDGSEYHCGYSDAMIDAAGIARQALTGEA